MAFILVTAPVYDRSWILPTWFSYLENQDFAGELGFSFECGPDDHTTMQCLLDFQSKHPELRCFDIRINSKEQHRTHPEGFRTWRKEHYTSMANFRNNLLNRATAIQPDRVFSLDTDILLEDPSTISQLYELTNREDIDVVSPLLFMMPDNIHFPNVMTWNSQLKGYRKTSYPLGKLFQADIIMAAVMMKKSVYTNVRYDWHFQGEDLGFAANLKNKNYKSYIASYIYADHVMSRSDLEKRKTEIDPRKLLLQQEGLDHILCKML